MVRAADLLYRLLYGGVLSRLPERIAVPLGQWALRLVPLDLLPVFRNDDPRLAITLGGVRLPNPLILSSMYYDTTILRRAMGLGFGAVTAKSITSKPRPGHPQPNLVRITTPEGPGLVNCNGFHNPGLDAYRIALASLPHRVEEPRLSQKAGGLSGPALFARTLENVRRLREKFGDSIEIIATGGIDAPDKAQQVLQAGATACGYFTGFITRGPLLARRILDALVKARR